jgi:hypothetical protein
MFIFSGFLLLTGVGVSSDPIYWDFEASPLVKTLSVP